MERLKKIGKLMPRASSEIKESPMGLGMEKLDRDAFASSDSCIERDVCKPQFLEARGWTLLRVWSRDWWLSPQRVIKAITTAAEKNRKGEKSAK